MEKEILEELKQFKSLFLKVTGTSDIPATEIFKKEALDKAAKQFQKMEIQRGEWVAESDLSNYFKDVSWMAGKFIREEFEFTAWIKHGKEFHYNKQAIKELVKELKERNLHLGRYIEYKRSQAEFQMKVDTAKERSQRLYLLPDDARNVSTSPIPMPDVELVKADLERLKAEFFIYKMADYVDIYKSNYSMLKTIYYFEKYIDPMLKKRCIKWCDSFNYANKAFELITGKKDKQFEMVKEEEKIEL
jgi:hypothetical protein